MPVTLGRTLALGACHQTSNSPRDRATIIVREMIRRTDWPRRIPLTMVALAAFAALVLTLWLPFGWKVTGLYEEWFVMSGGDIGNPVRMLYNPPSNQSYRPLTVAPYILGYILTPDSFIGFNIIFA